MKKVLFISCLLFALSACEKEETPNPPVAEAPFPFLKVGNKWVYDFRMNDVFVDSLVHGITGETAGVFDTYMEDQVTRTEEKMFVEGDKLKSFPAGSEKSKANTMAIKDAKVGDSWMKYTTGDSAKVEITEVGKQIQTPAGTIACRVLKETSFKTGQVIYTSTHNQFGLIRIEMTTQGKKYEWLLRSKNF